MLQRTPGVVAKPFLLRPIPPRGRCLSPRWDLWALAVIAYETLCGCVPFAGEDLTMLQSSIKGVNFPSVTSLVPEAPPRWQAFFERVFAHVEKDRVGSVALFWQELLDCLQTGLS
jgi:serine/threonine-protein kinase